MFINIRLCNNDYCMELDEVAAILYRNLPGDFNSLDESRVTEVVIKTMVALSNMRYLNMSDEFRSGTESYLRSKLKVTFDRHAPTEDHDGGSVVINCNTGHIWRY